jgi:uncharacterized protein (DUF362 family)
MARSFSRRSFLDMTAATLGGLALSACAPGATVDDPAPGPPGTGPDAPPASPPGTAPGAPKTPDPSPVGSARVGISSYEAAGARKTAVREAVALAGGMPWLKPGDTVLIKPAHNGTKPYPFTASAIACAELVAMCVEAGAKRVYVADVMGIENTLVPGRWALESPFGGTFYSDTDATLRAFRASGLYQTIVDRVGAANVGPTKKVHITSFREQGWSPFETGALTVDGRPRLTSDWIKKQLETAEKWTGERKIAVFTPRAFDKLYGGDVAGFYVPNLVQDVDHVINMHRISTHVMSHYSLSLKNWVGIMRPDDRVWMHQLSYLKNNRGKGSDPIRTEPLYNEILAELHLATKGKERLCFADASEVIASGGPDETDQALYPARLMVAAPDPVTADVIGLSIIRMAVMATKASGGLGGICSPPPQSAGSLGLEEMLGQVIPWRGGAMHGNDAKLCEPKFSHWDWVTVQRGRELKLGAGGPADLDLRFSTTAGFSVPKDRRDFLDLDTAIVPARALT